MYEVTNIYIEGLRLRRGAYNLQKNKPYKVFINGKTDKEHLPKLIKFWERLPTGRLFGGRNNPLLCPSFTIRRKNVHGGKFTIIGIIKFQYETEETLQFEFNSKQEIMVSTRVLRLRIPPKDELKKY